jgi:hypothetical protein
MLKKATWIVVEKRGAWDLVFFFSANPGAYTRDMPPTMQISANRSRRSWRGRRVAPIVGFRFPAQADLLWKRRPAAI